MTSVLVEAPHLVAFLVELAPLFPDPATLLTATLVPDATTPPPDLASPGPDPAREYCPA